MARHILGKKINENGTLEDLGNTISDEDLDYIDHTSNYLEWTKSRTISGTYTTIELFKVAPKSLSSNYFISAEVTTNDGYDFTLIVYDGVAKITKDVDGKLYSKENTNSMFSYPPQLGVYFGYDYVSAMFKTTGAWVKVKVSAIGCWEDDRSYVNIETLYSGIQAGYTLPTWTRVANESNLVISASLQNLLSKSGGTITGNLEVNGNLTKNGVNVATIQDIPSTENFIQKENPVGTGSLSLNRKEDTVIGNYSTSIGKNTTASAEASFAEGDNTEAHGFSDHAEGRNTLAQGGNGAHAEGYQTKALWAAAHAEGMYTEARGACSHAGGSHTIALSQSQFVFGEWNEKDPSGATTGYKGTYVEIVGNGTAEDDRSNARTLDWDGNETLSGNVTAKGFKVPNGKSTQFLKADGSVEEGEFVEVEDYLPNTPIGSPLDNYYTKTEYNNLDSVKFLNEEYEKTLNLIHINNKSSSTTGNVTYSVSDGVVKMSGTSNGNALPEVRFPNITLKPNTQYTLINYGTIFNYHISIKNDDGSNYQTLINAKSITFTTGSSSKVVNWIGMWIANGEVAKDMYIMLVEGSEIPTEYYSYNGAIVHKKDVDGVLLWQNGNTGNSFSSTTLSLDLSNYRRVRVVFRGYTTGSQYYTVEGDVGKMLIVLCNAGLDGTAFRIDTRSVQINSDSVVVNNCIRWQNGKSQQTVNNNCIPAEIYGFK